MTDEIRIIERQTGASLGLREVLARRELLWMLAQRQIAARYRQMLLGIVWIALEPLGQLLLLTIVFGVLLEANTAGYPYPLFAFAGLAGWWLFSKALMAAAGSLQDNMGLISKVYFPRLVLPLAAVAKELFDSGILLVMLLLVAMIYGFWPSFRALWIFPILFFAALLGIGIGLWFCAIMVKFRDMRPMLTLILQAGMYATPIVYAAEMVPERFLSIYTCNPMYWVVELSRWALLDKSVAITAQFYWATVASLIVLFGGLFLFSFTEKLAVDVQ